MKLTTVSMLSAIAVFVATLPHGVGAWLVKSVHNQAGCVKLFAIQPIDHKTQAKMFARYRVNNIFKDSDRQWSALTKLWGKESAWNYKAKNPRSSAYGIAQILNTPRNSTIEYQVNNGLKYIVHRYGTPERAWAFWQRNGWY
jgi:tRNA(Met) C34 N-acetyltransferase TmcA